jgi:hypothetical protein
MVRLDPIVHVLALQNLERYYALLDDVPLAA